MLAAIGQGRNKLPDARSQAHRLGLKVEVPLSAHRTELIADGGGVLRCRVNRRACSSRVAVFDSLELVNTGHHC